MLLNKRSRWACICAATWAEREGSGNGGIASAPRQQPRTTSPEGYGEWWDENFAFIADFTEGGAPYGLTWEQVDENGNLKAPPPPPIPFAEDWEELEGDWPEMECDRENAPPVDRDGPGPGDEIPY